MSYFIFDMDETIAELYTVSYFISSLRPKNPTTQLNKAYKNFIIKILEEETSNRPLGILRPGILKIMRKLYKLQSKSIIKGVIIYSNNNYLECLEFIRDLIHKYIESNQLIKECVHWNHPMRKKEIQNVNNKTWDVIKNIIKTGKYKDLNVDPKNVYFFDDLDHPDLKKNIVYYKVPVYNYKASFDRIADIYKDILSNILPNNILSEKSNDIIKIKGTASVNKIPPLPDDGINMMMDAIKKSKKSKKSKKNTVKKS